MWGLALINNFIINLLRLVNQRWAIYSKGVGAFLYATNACALSLYIDSNTSSVVRLRPRESTNVTRILKITSEDIWLIGRIPTIVGSHLGKSLGKKNIINDR